jgi:hypothetical protein
MNRRLKLIVAFAVAVVALPSLLLSASIVTANDTGVGDKRESADPVPWTGPVPKANCGPGDRTESGLQGQTTPEERFSGDSARGYNCNLELGASTKEREHFRRMDRRTPMNAPITQRTILLLSSSTTASWWWMPRIPGVHSRPHTWTTLPRCCPRTRL